ncbi:MAG TPA: hypothetical protein VMZ91_11155 [Candidatus Paceibacterota bacterium]|nr:hypothetical protein [Candidatus Paceibacterota bacterium]
MIKKKLTVKDISDYIKFIKSHGEEVGCQFLVSRFFNISYEKVSELDYRDFELLNIEVQVYLNGNSKREIVDIIEEVKTENKNKIKKKFNKNHLLDLE